MMETPDLRLRAFEKSDDAEVTSWFPDAGAVRFFAGKRLKWPLTAEQWDGIRSDETLTAWTAILGDDTGAVGHGELVRETESVVRLARLAVAPAVRGRGVGRALVAALVAMSRANGYSRATLTVHPDNANAIRAYRGLGFRPVSEQGAKELRMELDLTK